jgi:hypothetical protein
MLVVAAWTSRSQRPSVKEEATSSRKLRTSQFLVTHVPVGYRGQYRGSCHSDDDEPRSKKRRDEDDPDDESRSARKPKRKKQGGMGVLMLVGGLLGGGVLLVIACGGCGGVGYWLYTVYGTSPIVGTWEQTNNPFGTTTTFQDNGRGTAKLQKFKGSFKYEFNGNTLEMERDNVVVGGFNRMSRFNVTFNGNNELVLTSLDLPGAPQERFRRKG